MSDRYKFRAWSVKYQYMHIIDDLYYFEENSIHEIVGGKANSVEGEVIIMQSTGLRDRNGVLIFEGDVVAFTDKVEWYRGEFGPKVMLGIMTTDEAKSAIDKKPVEKRIVELPGDYHWLLSSEIQQYWEVIGNKFENPDLIP